MVVFVRIPFIHLKASTFSYLIFYGLHLFPIAKHTIIYADKWKYMKKLQNRAKITFSWM